MLLGNTSPSEIVQIALRRKWVLVFCLVLGAAVAYGISKRLPTRYRSETLVMVVPGDQAQTAPPMGSYAELTAAATLGHKSDSSISGEAAAQLTERWQLFGEAGRMGNVATSTIDGRAQAIANLMGGSVTAVQRALYADEGLRFQPTPIDRWHPYALVGLGVAGVKTNATFVVNGTVVSAPQLLAQYGVQPGTELSGTVRKLLLVGGGGVHVAFGSRYLVDISYRYGYAFPRTSEIVGDAGIQTQRLQTGLGMRF